jgi:nicotinamidase-related amidase
LQRRTETYIEECNADMKTDNWLNHIRDTAVHRPNLKLRPANCALLIIDMINHFAEPSGRCFLPVAPVVSNRIRRILDVWRDMKGTIIFTRHGHSGTKDLGMMGKFYTNNIDINLPESEIIKELPPLPDEKVIIKTTYDAFINTDLKGYLTNSGVSQVLITGLLTHLCCETTARSAFCHGFEVYFAADATATTSEQLHTGSLAALADGFAVLMSGKEIIERCVRKK